MTPYPPCFLPVELGGGDVGFLLQRHRRREKALPQVHCGDAGGMHRLDPALDREVEEEPPVAVDEL